MQQFWGEFFFLAELRFELLSNFVNLINEFDFCGIVWGGSVKDNENVQLIPVLKSFETVINHCHENVY